MRRALVPEDITERLGLTITTPERTFVDIAEDVSLGLVVAFGDYILRQHLATPTAIADCLARSRGRRGVRRARQAADLLDARAESPPESVLRVALIAAGLPAPTPQYVIRSTDGHFIARGDLVFEDERIVIEYDGEYHLTPEQQAKDADRRHRLMLEGWLVVTITRRDLRDPRRAVSKVNDALRQRRPIGYASQVTADRSVVESAHEGRNSTTDRSAPQ